MTSSRDLKGQLDVMLLAVISSGERYGYAIIRSLQQRSNGRFTMKEGTVYPALHRLEDEGLITSRLELVEGRQRRLYELTATGRASLVEQRAAWTDYAAGVTAVLGLST